jgi:hypothetical protein
MRSLRVSPLRTSPGCAKRSPTMPGSEAIANRFAGWFGDTEDFEVVETTVGEVGGRSSLRWRMRLRAGRLGQGWFTIEQQAYADTRDGHIAQLDLLCTGYRAEADDA